jgi:hypothetical protein
MLMSRLGVSLHRSFGRRPVDFGESVRPVRKVPGVYIAGGTEAPSFFASLTGRVVFFLSLAAASAISVAVCQFIAFRH